jgi:hypothetical protein
MRLSLAARIALLCGCSIALAALAMATYHGVESARWERRPRVEGGLAIARTGNYDWMWYADMVLAAAAAVVNLPIREAVLQSEAKPA